MLRITIARRQREMGLGNFPTVSLAEAREKARDHRARVALGDDPISVRRAAQSASAAERQAQQTFSTVASQYIAQHEKSWKNAKHAAQWQSTLKMYVEPVIGKLFVRDVTAAHVIKLLEPIWVTKTETASRVRSRVELVLDFAAARGLRDGPNPARWRGNLDAAFPKASRVARVQHHAAVAVADIKDFMLRLRQQPGMGAKALEFTILTAARSGEVRGLTWGEIDLSNAVWTVPPDRMKGGRPHRVPLSRAALKLLKTMPTGKPGELVFPGRSGPLSDMSLTAVLRRMEVPATAHGFRSTFRDWAAELTSYANEVAEMALAHSLGDKVEAAYRRGDMFEKRISMMSDWAKFLG